MRRGISDKSCVVTLTNIVRRQVLRRPRRLESHFRVRKFYWIFRDTLDWRVGVERLKLRII